MLPEIDTFYDRLLYAKERYDKRLPWSTVADVVGINKTNFSRYKSGKYFPSEVTLLKLAYFFSVDAVWLAGDDINVSGEGLALLSNIYESLDQEGQKLLIGYAQQLYKEQL